MEQAATPESQVNTIPHRNWWLIFTFALLLLSIIYCITGFYLARNPQVTIYPLLNIYYGLASFAAVPILFILFLLVIGYVTYRTPTIIRKLVVVMMMIAVGFGLLGGLTPYLFDTVETHANLLEGHYTYLLLRMTTASDGTNTRLYKCDSLSIQCDELYWENGYYEDVVNLKSASNAVSVLINGEVVYTYSLP